MRKSYVSSLLVASLIVAFLATFVSEAQVDPKGMIIHFSFDKDTIKGNDVKDLSGNKPPNDGLIKGDVKPDKGKVGEGLKFPGVANSYISVRNHHYAKADTEEITLAAWVKASGRGMIASWDRSEFFRFGVGDDQLGNNDFIAFDTCCGIHDWHGKIKITDNKWHHVVAQFERGKKRIYVDGKLDADIDAPHKIMGKVITRYGFVGIGSEAGAFDAATGPTWAFNGIMDQFMLFHRALSEEEVITLAKGQANPFAVDPDGKIAVTWGEIKASR